VEVAEAGIAGMGVAVMEHCREIVVGAAGAGDEAGMRYTAPAAGFTR